MNCTLPLHALCASFEEIYNKAGEARNALELCNPDDLRGLVASLGCLQSLTEATAQAHAACLGALLQKLAVAAMRSELEHEKQCNPHWRATAIADAFTAVRNGEG